MGELTGDAKAEFAAWKSYVTTWLIERNEPCHVWWDVQDDCYGWQPCGAVPITSEADDRRRWLAFHAACVAAEPLRPAWMAPSAALLKALAAHGLAHGAN